MRWGRSRRYSSANLPALRAGDGGIFPSADGGAVSLGQRHAGLSPVAGCGERWAVGHRATYDGRLLGDWLHRLRPPLETISWAGWASPAARIWRIFQCHRSPRSALYAARRLLRHGWQRLRAGRGSIWSMAMRWSPVCCDPPSTPACVFSSMPGGPAAAGSAGRVRRKLRSDSGRFTSKLAPWCWPAAVFPRSPAAAGRCPTRRRVTAISPPHRRTIRARDQALANPSAASSDFPAPPAGPAPVSRVTLASGQQLMFPFIWWSAPNPVIAVLPNGKRFVNEADSYHDFIAALLAATPAGDTPQARLLADRRTLRRYGLGPRQTVPVHPHRPAAYRLSARNTRREAVRYRRQCWRKPLNALTTSPALAKTSIFTAEHQPITAPVVTIR